MIDSLSKSGLHLKPPHHISSSPSPALFFQQPLSRHNVSTTVTTCIVPCAASPSFLSFLRVLFCCFCLRVVVCRLSAVLFLPVLVFLRCSTSVLFCVRVRARVRLFCLFCPVCSACLLCLFSPSSLRFSPTTPLHSSSLLFAARMHLTYLHPHPLAHHIHPPHHHHHHIIVTHSATLQCKPLQQNNTAHNHHIIV